MYYADESEVIEEEEWEKEEREQKQREKEEEEAWEEAVLCDDIIRDQDEYDDAMRDAYDDDVQ